MSMIKETQYRKLISVYNRTREITMSSLKAGVDRKTGSKHIKGGKSPLERRRPHGWRTRPDPFADVEGEVEGMLGNAYDLEPLTIFRHLQEKYPGRFQDGQLRTMERRVREWKMRNGSGKAVSIPQVHVPGRLMELDWTNMNELEVGICGVPFRHLLCHAVMTYSNWEWAEIASGESFSSLRKGFQSAVFRLGAVPEILQTDNSSAATHQGGKGVEGREFNHEYATFLEHYGVRPRCINVNSPDENGDIEAANGHLKRRIGQHLSLRGSRDFGSVEEYRQFIAGILVKANSGRTEKVREELDAMRPLPDTRLPEYAEEEKTVSAFGTVRVGNVAYSVPPRLRGCRVRVRIHEDRIDVFSGRMKIAGMEKRSGREYCVDYRHVVESLRRKPGAFAGCRYRDQLFPGDVFREAYGILSGRLSGTSADREYIEILSLAANNGEEKVSGILGTLIRECGDVSADAVRKGLDIPAKFPEVNVGSPEFFIYDGLLQSEGGLSHAN
jgi:hypothetical protein